MGGFGSGRRGWLPVVEDGLKLDIRRLRKQGLLQENVSSHGGSIVWSYTATGEKIASAGYSFDTHSDLPWFELKYSVTNSNGDRESVNERFALERFPQPYGGHRWYIRCPSSGRRCQCLYKPAGAIYFRSRQAYRMQYHSQCEDFGSRMISQMHRVSDKVLNQGPPDWREKYGNWEFPPKPPWMRWATYNRHYDRRYELEEAVDLAFIRRFGNIDGLFS